MSADIASLPVVKALSCPAARSESTKVMPMKPSRNPVSTSLWVVVLALLSGCATSSSHPPGGGGTATVRFTQPEQFTDVQRSGQTTAESRGVLLPMIEKYVQQEAARSLPAGQQLDVEFLDIDQAGRIPPASHHALRVMSDNLPARLVFRYELRDASGAVLKSGRESLSKDPRGSSISYGGNPGELDAEKRLLRDWVRQVSR